MSRDTYLKLKKRGRDIKGILFKPDMIKAIVKGRKTVTRRIIKPQPTCNGTDLNGKTYYIFKGKEHSLSELCKCSRYHVGETVYVKEAYMVNKEYDHLKPYEIPEIGSTVSVWYYASGNHYADKVNLGAGKVRSPLFMPAWAARYFIKILEVRVERLQEITEEDCKLEGIKVDPYEDWKVEGILKFWQGRFFELWDKINPDYPWESNPWLFRYLFKQVEANHATE